MVAMPFEPIIRAVMSSRIRVPDRYSASVPRRKIKNPELAIVPIVFQVASMAHIIGMLINNPRRRRRHESFIRSKSPMVVEFSMRAIRGGAIRRAILCMSAIMFA
jgi:hypothetical protein